MKEQVELIMQVVAKEFKVEPKMLTQKTRKREVSDARQVAQVIASELFKTSSYQTIMYFFNKERSTIYNSIVVVEERKETIPGYRKKIEALKEECKVKLEELNKLPHNYLLVNSSNSENIKVN